MDSNQDSKLNDPEIEVTTSSTHHHQLNQGISDEDFREILSFMSGWYDRHGHINMLKVLFRDLVTEPDKLYTATKVIELFELVCTAGHLSSADLTVLYDTINVTQPFGLELKIRKLPTLLNIRTVIISKFTYNRQMLIKVVKSLSDNGVKKISQLYNCPQKADRWELFVDLEQRSEFCEENMDDFMRKITTFLIRDSHKGLMESDDKDVATTIEATGSPSTSTANDQGELMVTGDTDVATRETGPSTSTDNVCMVNNMVIQGNQGSVTGSQFHNCSFGTVNIINSTTEVPAIQGNPNDAEHVTSSANPRHQEQLDIIIKDDLRKLYRDVNLMTPAIWHESHVVDIAQVFTELILVQSKRKDEGAQAKSTSIIQEGRPALLTEVLGVIKSIDSCKVLITGKGGMGKTTLLRYIAHNWATDGDNTFAGKLLFLINIRDIKAGTNLLEVIMKQINTEEIILKKNLPNDSVKRFLVNHDNEIVILLDGYDELKRDAKDLMNLFKGREFGKSTVVITSRPENTTDLTKSCDVHIEVKGFSPRNIMKYIDKHFDSLNKTELGESLIKEFKLHAIEKKKKYVLGGNHKEAFKLCSSPLLLLKICTIWEHKQHLPKNLSDLFKELFCCILNQYISRGPGGNKTAISKFDRIPEQYKSAILALGECIYEGLKDNTLSVDKYDLTKLTKMAENEDLVGLALRPGFVYRDSPVAADDLREIYTPPHKLISEALAGFYLSEQSQKESLESHEYEMIRSNEYLHMTRVFAIGFLGADAGKLLKHWMKNRASNYYSLAKYFKYVKKEHEEHVLHALGEHMSTEMKVHCTRMCESFRYVLCIGGGGGDDDDDNDIDDIKATVSQDAHLIQLMSQCCVEYKKSPWSMLPMIKKSAELSIKDVCAMLVDILIIVEGLYTDQLIPPWYYRSVLNYLANWKDIEIGTITAEMKNRQFMYHWKDFYSHGPDLNPNLLIHLLKTASELTDLRLAGCVTGVGLNQAFIELLEIRVSLKLRLLHLSHLSDVNGESLANLLKIAPKLKELCMNSCKLSATIINTMVTECQSQKLVFELHTLVIDKNDLSGVNGVSLANLLKIAPKLKELCMNSCKLSGTIINTMVTECQSQKLVFELHTLAVDKNDLSGVNGVSLANLFKFAPKLKELCMNSCKLSGTTINTMVTEYQSQKLVFELHTFAIDKNDLSGVNGVSLANLLKIAPKLKKLVMSSCKLSDTIVSTMVTECQSQKLVFELHTLDIDNNDLSDFNGVSLANLLKIAPKLKKLDMSRCKLSDTIINTMVTECQSKKLVFELNTLCLGLHIYNGLSEVSFAETKNKLRQIFPKLEILL